MQLEEDLLETQSLNRDVGAEPVSQFALPFILPAGQHQLCSAAIAALRYGAEDAEVCGSPAQTSRPSRMIHTSLATRSRSDTM